MFEKFKTFAQEQKTKLTVGAASAPVAVVASALPAYASGGGTDETTAFTTGVTNFMSVVSTIMSTIVGSPILMIFVGAAAATVALSLVRRLIGRM